MTVKPAQHEDWEAIRSLLSDASLPIDDLETDNLDNFLVARTDADGQDVAGAIGLEVYGDVGLLRSLVVASGKRGGGVAARLIAALESKAVAAGVRQLYLLTIDADGYFLVHGFELVARDATPPPIRATREFSELCPDDAIVMRKTLPDRAGDRI